jgi:hypothetical protein
MTSPPAFEPSATQMGTLIEFLKNRSERSARSEFTPLERRMREAADLRRSFPCKKKGRFWPVPWKKSVARNLPFGVSKN